VPARNTFDLSLDGMLGIQTQLSLLSLSPQMRRRLLNQVAKRVRAMSGKRVREQKNLDGSAYAPRKGKGRKKMLSGLIKNKYLNVLQATPDMTRLGWNNSLMGWIAAQHNDGQTERRTAAQARKANPTDYHDPCTDEQAKLLRRLGFKAFIDGRKKRVRASAAWIKEHINFGQAGLLIRVLKNERAGPASWEIKLPKRDFLGADPSDIARLVKLVLEQILNSPR
jgi:hypothetical protein